MKTFYDFASIAVFAVLVVLFLHRSTMSEPDPTPMWKYALPAVGCALANYLGNQQQPIIAAAVLAGAILFIIAALDPLRRGPTA